MPECECSSCQAPLEHTWLLRSAKFWNSVARRPASDLYYSVLQDCCRDAIVHDIHNWARDLWQSLRDLGYFLPLSVVEIPIIDIDCLSRKLDATRDAAWTGLHVCPRTCPSLGVIKVTYERWMAKPEWSTANLLALRVSARRLRQLLRFRTGCHGLAVDALRRNSRGRARVDRHLRLCTACNSGQVGDEQHLVFECAALQHLRDQQAHLFQPGLSMQQFMWQPDLAGVAKFVADGLDILRLD